MLVYKNVDLNSCHMTDISVCQRLRFFGSEYSDCDLM